MTPLFAPFLLEIAVTYHLKHLNQIYPKTFVSSLVYHGPVVLEKIFEYCQSYLYNIPLEIAVGIH